MRKGFFLQLSKTIGLLMFAAILVSLAQISAQCQSATSLIDYFGVVTAVQGQQVRLNFTNLGSGRLTAQLQLFDTRGKLLQYKEDNVASGKSFSLTYSPPNRPKCIVFAQVRGVVTVSGDAVNASDFVSTMEILSAKPPQIFMSPIRRSGVDDNSVAFYTQQAKASFESAQAAAIKAEAAANDAKVPGPRAAAAANKAEAAAARAEDAAAKVCAMI